MPLLKVVKAQKGHMQQTTKSRGVKYLRAAPSQKCPAALKHAPRWLPVREELASAKVAEWIRKHCPEGVMIDVDDYNGRFRVIGAALQEKSISWTLRGWKAAAFQALWWCWEFHCDLRGCTTPFDRAALEAEFQEEVQPVTAASSKR